MKEKEQESHGLSEADHLDFEEKVIVYDQQINELRKLSFRQGASTIPPKSVSYRKINWPNCGISTITSPPGRPCR